MSSLILDFFHSDGGGGKRIYGVVFDGATNSIGIRTRNAIGMKFSPSNNTTAGKDDFSKIENSPFDIRECLTYYDSTKGKQIVHKMQGDSNYDTDRTNTNYNIMMRFPKFYYRRPSKWEFQVSSYPHEGFLPSPMHHRNGIMHDYAYLAKYHANTNFISQTGQVIATNETWTDHGYNIGTFREAFNNQGMYVWDYPLWSSLQILMLVKYATLDVQSLIGFGISNQATIQNTGDCDSVKGLDGYCAANKTDNGSIVCFGIENLYSNCTRFIDGVFRNLTTMYINTDIANLNKGKTNPTINSHPGYYATTTPTLNYTGVRWITDIAYDSQFPWAMYPTAITGDNSDYTQFDFQTNPGLPINDTYNATYSSASNADWEMLAGGTGNGGFSNGPFQLNLSSYFATAIPGLSASSFFLSD